MGFGFKSCGVGWFEEGTRGFGFRNGGFREKINGFLRLGAMDLERENKSVFLCFFFFFLQQMKKVKELGGILDILA